MLFLLHPFMRLLICHILYICQYIYKMKTRLIIYIVLGILFFLLNIVSTINMIAHHQFDTNDNKDDFAYQFGTVIGSQIFLYISLLFFYGSYRVSIKLKAKKLYEWQEQIERIGKEN